MKQDNLRFIMTVGILVLIIITIFKRGIETSGLMYGIIGGIICIASAIICAIYLIHENNKDIREAYEEGYKASERKK